MNTFVLLYRGINVGGNHPVKMELLRAMHERLGHQNVQSYIQSGNLILTAPDPVKSLAAKTAAAFAKTFKFDARILVIDAKRFGKIIEENPYADAAAKNPKVVHAAICEGEPDGDGLTALLAKTRGTENFAIKPGVLYLHAWDGFGTSKFAAGMEKASGVPMTVRNWRTMETLGEMLKG